MDVHMFKSRTFRKTVLSYAMILIIPIFIFFYISMKNIIDDNHAKLIEMHNTDSKRVAAAIDSKLIDVMHIGDDLYHSKWINKAMVNLDSFDEEFNIITRQEINQDLKKYIAYTGLLSNVSVVFPYKDLVVAQNGWYEMDNYFTNILEIQPDDVKNINAGILEYDYLRIIGDIEASAKSTVDNNIVISRSLEINNNPRAVLLYFIKKEYLHAYVEKITLPSLNNLAIIGNGTEIYNSLSEEEQDDELLSFTIPSEVFPWEYICTYNSNDLPIHVSQLLPLYMGISLSLAAGFVMALFLAIVLYKPLYNLFNNIFKHENAQVVPIQKAFFEYSAIETSFDKLVDKNQELIERMRNYESAVRNNLLLQLLKGYFDDTKLNTKLKEIGIPYTNEDYFCVILINIGYIKDDRPEDVFVRKQGVINSLIIAEGVVGDYNVDYEIVDVFDDTFALILSFDNIHENTEFLEELFLQIKKDIEKSCNIEAIMTKGNLEKGIIGISKSYQMARDNIEYIIFGSNDASLNSIGILKSELYYYPTDWEIQLINNLKVGGLDTVTRILDEMKLENESRDLPQGSLIRLVSVVMETQLRVLDELNMDAKLYQEGFEKIISSGDIDVIWEYVYVVSERICSRSQYANTVSHFELGNRIIDYIEDNYSDPELSLKGLADTFNMPISSLSRLLKEVTGVKYYDYLSLIRIEKAKMLLTDTDKNIAEIAIDVGYENEQSFRRAFKRYEGITPSGYQSSKAKGS